MKWFRKSLILIHRYLGIVLSLLFVIWFISGIGMMYAKGMPRLTPALRLQRLSAIDLSKIRLTPIEAAARLENRDSGSGRVSVAAILDRPVYRLGGGRGGSIVFADDGSVLDGVDADMAKAIAGRFMNVPSDSVHHSLLTETNQWTIGQRRQLPLHEITVDDSDRTVLYISPQSGEVVVLTTRGSRALAWVAAIPHWLYFTPLRVNDRLWTQVIIWTSVAGCVLAVIGIVLGVIQFKPSKPVRLSRVSSYIPYFGLMRWHYITGVVFGVLTLTWTFSGLLSMDPWQWVSGDDLQVSPDAFTEGSLDPEQYPPFDSAAWSQLLPGRAIKEIEYTRIQGDPYYVVRDANSERLLIAANPLQVRREPFSTESLLERLKKAAPDANIIESQLITEYDSYYYSQDGSRPLPMFRAKFDDPKQTWVYIDAMLGQVAGQLHRGDRIQRWLFNGFHSLDFSFWHSSRPAWDIGLIVLNLGGAVVSGIGLWLGMRRIGRGLKRFGKPVRAVVTEETHAS
jgi:uncharacterized iron-regulated membrane protein